MLVSGVVPPLCFHLHLLPPSLSYLLPPTSTSPPSSHINLSSFLPHQPLLLPPTSTSPPSSHINLSSFLPHQPLLLPPTSTSPPSLGAHLTRTADSWTGKDLEPAQGQRSHNTCTFKTRRQILHLFYHVTSKSCCQPTSTCLNPVWCWSSVCPHRAIVNLLQPASTQCDVGPVCVSIELHLQLSSTFNLLCCDPMW